MNVVIVLTFADLDDGELADHRPRLVFVDELNRPVGGSDAGP